MPPRHSWKIGSGLAAEVDRELTPEQRQAFRTMTPKPSELGLEVLHLPPGNATPPK